METRKCKLCDEAYIAKKSHQKFCCESHRKKWHRINGKKSNRTPSFISERIILPSRGTPLQKRIVRESQIQHVVNRNAIVNSKGVAILAFAIGFFSGGQCKEGKHCKGGLNSLKGTLYGIGLSYIAHRVSKRVNESTKMILPVNREVLKTKNLNEIKEVSEVENSISNGVIDANSYRAIDIPTIGFTDKWFYLLNDPCPGFYMMVTGSPGQGKSTFCVKLANYLQSLGKVLYATSEQSGVNQGFQIILNRENAANFEIDIHPKNTLEWLDEIMGKYDYVILDSINDMRFKSNELFAIHKKHPKCATIAIMQSNKDGGYKGSQQFLHDCDIRVNLVNRVADVPRNRFGTVSAELPIENL